MVNKFRFKLFSLDHGGSSMKVGTDAVLTGAWSDHTKPRKILDVGTGCGIIGLMLAQRYPNAIVDLLDDNAAAIHQAKKNAANSPFSERINVFHLNYLNFTDKKSYDLIVSNPPYHTENAIPLVDNRSKSRNNTFLPFDKMIEKSAGLLSEDGILTMILPTKTYAQCDHLANHHKLWCRKRLLVSSRPDEKPVRVIASWSPKYSKTVLEHLNIYDKDNYSSEYKEMTKDFYLNF